jgi:hypothetical protein
MDENTRLLLDLTRNVPPEPHPDWEPMNYDIETLLDETRKRVYTEEAWGCICRRRSAAPCRPRSAALGVRFTRPLSR